MLNQNLTNSNFDPKIRYLAYIVILFSIAYGAHLRYTVLTSTVIHHPIRADAVDYYSYAINIKQYGVYSKSSTLNEIDSKPEPDALRAPGFPFFASLFVSNNGAFNIAKVCIAQTVLQFFSFLLITFCFVRVLGLACGAIASLLLWIFPHYTTINTYFLTESLFTSLLCISFFLYYQSNESKLRQNTYSLIILSGLVFGLAAITRSILQYFPIFLVIYIAFTNREWLKRVLLFSSAALIPIFIWKLRNISVLGEGSDPHLLVNAIYHGSFPGMMYNGDPKSFAFPYRFDPEMNNVSGNLKATIELMFLRAQEKPWTHFSWYIFGKQFTFWGWSIIAGYGDIFIYPILKSPYLILPDMAFSRSFSKFLHPIWVTLGTLMSYGIFVARLKVFKNIDMSILFLSALISYLFLTTILTAPFPRYSIPFKWMVLLIAFYSLKKGLPWLIKNYSARNCA